jgi:hypothetical protein
VRTAVLAATVLVFAWPQVSVLMLGGNPWYPLVTIVFTVLIIATVITWPPGDRASISWSVSLTPAVPIVAVIAAAVVTFALYRWIRVIAWQPYGADMLIVIREATNRFLHGRTPYATYRSYDAPWNMVLPYGPALWGPFLVPQLLRLDFRTLTIVDSRRLAILRSTGRCCHYWRSRSKSDDGSRRPVSLACWFSRAPRWSRSFLYSWRRPGRQTARGFPRWSRC